MKCEVGLSHRWIDHLDRVISNYNNCVHSTTGIKPFVLFRSSDRVARRYLNTMRNNTDINLIRQRVRDYIEKWKCEYETRANQPNLGINNRFFLAISYRRNLNRSLRGVFDNLYENDTWKIVEIEESHFIISNYSSNEMKRIRKCMVKKINE